MRLQDPLIALLVASVFFTGLFGVFIGLSEEYNINNDMQVFTSQENTTSLEEAYANITDIKNRVDDVTSSFEESFIASDGNIFSFFALTFNIGKQILSNLTLFKDIFAITAEIIGIPTIFITLSFSLLLLSFVLLVIFLLLGRTVES